MNIDANKKAFYKKIQERLDSNNDEIKEKFLEALDRVQADEGFFGCEDQEGFIVIKQVKGKYFHLEKNRGFTGTVYMSGEAKICDMKGAFEDPSGLVKAEMAAPVFLDKQIVGVILVDRHSPDPFNNEDLSILISYANKFGDILSERPPWPFRQWWKKHNTNCIEEYRSTLEYKLTDKLNHISNISACTALVEDNNTIDLKPLETEKTQIFRGRIANDVIRTGKGKYNPEKITRGELAVPFPQSGSIKGLVSVERYSDELGIDRDEQILKDEDLLQDIQQIVESIEFSYFDLTAYNYDPSSLFYSILFKCFDHQEYICNILDKVAADARQLCDAEIKIFISGKVTNFGASIVGRYYIIEDEEKIKNYFGENTLHGIRPKYSVFNERGNGNFIIRCPIWVNDTFFGCIEAKAKEMSDVDVKKEDLDVKYNGPVLEIVSTALSNAFKIHMMNECMTGISKLYSKKTLSNIEYINKYTEYSRLVLDASIISFWLVKDGQIRNVCISGVSEKDAARITETLTKVVSNISLEDSVINIKVIDKETMQNNFVKIENQDNIDELIRSLRKANIRTLIAAKQKNDELGHFVALACLIRDTSSKSSFGKQDEVNILLLASLFTQIK